MQIQTTQQTTCLTSAANVALLPFRGLFLTLAKTAEVAGDLSVLGIFAGSGILLDVCHGKEMQPKRGYLETMASELFFSPTDYWRIDSQEEKIKAFVADEARVGLAVAGAAIVAGVVAPRVASLCYAIADDLRIRCDHVEHIVLPSTNPKASNAADIRLGSEIDGEVCCC